MTSSRSRRRVTSRAALALTALAAVAAPVGVSTAGALTDTRSVAPHPESPLLALAGLGALLVLALLALVLVTVAVELLRSPGDDGGTATAPASRVPPTLRRITVGLLVGAAGLSPQLASAAPPRVAVADTTPAPVDPGYLPTPISPSPAPTSTTPTSPAPTSPTTPPTAPRTPTTAAAGTRTGTTPRTHLIEPGDTLWAVAERSLLAEGRHPDDARVARAVHLLYAANASAIGDDPDLIRPGTSLVVPDDLTARSAGPTPRSTP